MQSASASAHPIDHPNESTVDMKKTSCGTTTDENIQLMSDDVVYWW